MASLGHHFSTSFLQRSPCAGGQLPRERGVARVPHLDNTDVFLYYSLEHPGGIKPSAQGGLAVSIPFTDFSPSTALLFPLPRLCFLGPPLK